MSSAPRSDRLAAQAFYLNWRLDLRRSGPFRWSLRQRDAVGRYRNLDEVEVAVGMIRRGVFVPKLKVEADVGRR